MSSPFNVLFVCAADVAKSPLAAACMRDYVAGNGSGPAWDIRSAGTNATAGDGPRDEAIRIAESMKLDITGHTSRQLQPQDVTWANLIVAMSWEQASDVWSMAPDSWEKSFTLREFVHWAKQVPARPPILFPDKVGRMVDRIEQAHAIRRRARADFGFWGGMRPQDLNVIEPDGRGDAAWRSFATSIRTLVVDVVHLLGGP